MGGKLLWTGLTCLLALPAFLSGLGADLNTGFILIIGGILMVVGCILMWMNK